MLDHEDGLFEIDGELVLLPMLPTGWDLLAMTGVIEKIAGIFPEPPAQFRLRPKNEKQLRDISDWIDACAARAETVQQLDAVVARLQQLEEFARQIAWIAASHPLPPAPPPAGRGSGFVARRRARRERQRWAAQLAVAAERHDLLLHDALASAISPTGRDADT